MVAVFVEVSINTTAIFFINYFLKKYPINNFFKPRLLFSLNIESNIITES